MNISKILIIIAVLLMIFLVACEPDTGPPVEVNKETNGLCFLDSDCSTTATQPIGFVKSSDKTSANKCCSLNPQAKVSFCPEGKGLVRGNGMFAGCQQCVQIDCSTRTLTGPGVVQPTPKPIPQPIIPQPATGVTQTTDEEVVDYYCCVTSEDVFYPGPPYFKKVIDFKKNPKRCDPSFDKMEEAIDKCSPKVAQVGFKVNDVRVETDCESGHSISYVVLSDPKQEIAKVDFMYKTPEQKSWTGMKDGLFYDKNSNQYYNSAKLISGNYQYQISINTKTNTLITAKEGIFNVAQCPKGPLA